jgi:hypothetical protein
MKKKTLTPSFPSFICVCILKNAYHFIKTDSGQYLTLTHSSVATAACRYHIKKQFVAGTVFRTHARTHLLLQVIVRVGQSPGRAALWSDHLYGWVGTEVKT